LSFKFLFTRCYCFCFSFLFEHLFCLWQWLHWFASSSRGLPSSSTSSSSTGAFKKDLTTNTNTRLFGSVLVFAFELEASWTLT